MKIEELRIGNIIKDIISKKEYIVKAIPSSNTIKVNSITPIYININDLESIKLTEENIFGCGFIKTDNIFKKSYIKKNTSHSIILEKKSDEYLLTIKYTFNKLKDTMILKSISSLHELQNIYYFIFNEELIINL